MAGDPTSTNEYDLPAGAPSPGLGRLLALVRPQLTRILLATVLMLAGNAIGLLTPILAGRVVDTALDDASLPGLNRIVFWLVLLFAVMGFVAALDYYLLRTAGALLLRDLRARLFGHLINFAPDFFETRRVGELLSRMTSDLVVVQSVLTRDIPSGLQAAIRFVGTLIILLVLQTRLAVIALVVIPPIALLSVFYGRRLERLATHEQDATAETSAVAEEVLSGIRTVQAFTAERHAARRFGAGLTGLLGIQYRNARLEGTFSGLLLFAAFSAFGLVLWYGGRLLVLGQMTPGVLTSFLLYTLYIATSVGELGSLYGGYRELKGASVRMFHLLDSRPSVREADDAVALTAPRGHIALSGVDFRYPTAGDRGLALAGVEFEVQPGEMIGLVGPSGAGKTTVFALLLRYYDPVAGQVTVDGVDLRSARLGDLRRAIAVVPQEIFLFGGTVEENIRYGQPDASRQAVVAAAVAAGADEFIDRLPATYHEIVGPRGVRLSAGQRQRIAIARAFLKDPPILLLDEATSSLDPDSEQRVQLALSDLLRGRTTLVIAHRLATARRAHRLLVMERGRIVDSGTHDALYSSSEIYRRYWELQSLQKTVCED